MLRATLNECEKKWFKLSATSSKNCAGICVSWSRVCTVSAAAAAVFVCVRAEYGCAFYWHYCLLLHFLSFTMIAVWSSRLWPFSWFVAHLKWFRHKHKHNVPCALGKLSLVVCACPFDGVRVCFFDRRAVWDLCFKHNTNWASKIREWKRIVSRWNALIHTGVVGIWNQELNHPIHIQCGNFYLCDCECVCVCLCVDIVSISEDV